MTTPCCHEGDVHDQVFRGRRRAVVIIRPDRIVFSRRGTRLFRMQPGAAVRSKDIWLLVHRPPTRWSVGFIRLERGSGVFYERFHWYFMTAGQVVSRLPHAITFSWRQRTAYEALFATLSEIFTLKNIKEKESP
jgi:hypothetical protein